MSELRPRKILLQAYDIENNDLKSNISDLLEVLSRRLNAEGTVSDRRLKLSSSSDQEDVLSDYTQTTKGLFGVMLRISPSDTIATIPDSLFNGKTIKLNEPNSEGESTVTVLSTCYFFVGKKYLLSTLPPSQIKRLQVYFNFLLSFEGKERNYIFAPSIKVPDGIQLNEMKEFILGDQCHIQPPHTQESEPTGFKVIDLAVQSLKGLVSVVPNVDELIKSNIINARLLISFSKPRKMTNEDYMKALSYYIKPIGDVNDVKIKLKHKKTLKGKDVLLTKEVSISQLDSIRIDEAELQYEMKTFLSELES